MGRRYGIQISQEGIPLNRAADYQKVLDDRWNFLDIAFDTEVRFEKTAYDTLSSHFWKLEIFRHDLGYIPGFTIREIDTTTNGPLEAGNLTVVATKDKVYIQGLYISGSGTPPIVGRISLRIFAVDITTEYTQPIESITPMSRTKSTKYGAKVLKPGKGNLGINNQEMSNFSLNTDSKTLAIQQTGMLNINPSAYDKQANTTAVDTATDIITISATGSENIAWAQSTGKACQYSPGDFVTYPSPLSGATYYIIPVSASQVKLANNYQDALAGVAIDLTTAGSLPGKLISRENPAIATDTLTHNVGYPPVYMLCSINDPARWSSVFANPIPERSARPLGSGFTGFTNATTTTLRFRGAQSQLSGYYAYIILKDPQESAS